MKDIEAKFSVATLKVMSLSNIESRRLGHNFVGSEQLLLGILEEGTNQAALYFSSVALTSEVLKERIETRIGRGAGAVASEIPLTPNVRRIFALADDYAQNNSTIAPEHLMLGILSFGEGVAVELLRDLAVDTKAFHSHLIKVLSPNNLSNGVESDKPEGHTLGDRSYEIENAELFFEVIRVTALPQENGRWACSISGVDSVRPIITYADTKKAAISQSLRQLATKLELKLNS